MSLVSSLCLADSSLNLKMFCPGFAMMLFERANLLQIVRVHASPLGCVQRWDGDVWDGDSGTSKTGMQRTGDVNDYRKVGGKCDISFFVKICYLW